MDVRHLRLFIDVVRFGSFAEAARRSDMDPSQVSRIVAGLEDELEIRLFQRTTRRLAPTEAGRIYYERVEPLLDELERAGSAATEVGELPKGVIRVLSPVSYGLLKVAPMLPEFALRYPDLTFDLILSDAPLDLVSERIDVALRLAPISDSGLVAERLAPLHAAVCASPAYLRDRSLPVSPHELTAHNCLVLDHLPAFDSTWRFRAPDGSTQAIAVRGTLRSSNAIALKECALAGMGIVLQARWIVGDELHDGRLIDLFPEYEVSAQTIASPGVWILRPSRTYVPLKVRLFIDALRSHAGA